MVYLAAGVSGFTGQYDELGMLMASVAVIGLIVPIATVLLVNPASKHAHPS